MAMMHRDQRVGVRPITFVLDDRGRISSVTLPIRPEDLTRNESSRATVHQTLGRDVSGWVDNFGQALPSVTIAGNTGWRRAEGTGRDGYESFEALNQLVQRDFHNAKQDAIDSGVDPAQVRLLFVDTLDNFAWSVVPMQFTLRRSKSRPLLYQYNIVLQAISTDIDDSEEVQPVDPNYMAGMRSVSSAIFDLRKEPPEPSEMGGFDDMAADVSENAIYSLPSGSTESTNAAALLARDLALAGVNAYGILFPSGGPIDVVSDALKKAAALRNIACVFSNSLRPALLYEDYSDLFGASNCSSTSGGLAPSRFAGQNVFGLMIDSGAAQISVTMDAVSAIQALKNSDPVLSPLPVQEVRRYIDQILAGVSV